jgi:DNA helicase HerA-like ATPase
VTLQVIAESFCKAGVPCFMADMKGDLSGVSQPGKLSSFIEKRLPEFGIDQDSLTFEGCPVRFYDVYGEQGISMRATIGEMGPDLMARIMGLNETQTGVLNILYRILDERGILLDDLKDLRSALDWLSKHAKEYTTQYGNVSTASIGAIQRALLQLENQGADKFFGIPSFDIMDLLATRDGKGVLSVLAADKLMLQPKLYSTFLLWLLSELYSTLPEVGDVEQPKLVFFFDEAHMLFEDTSKALTDKIEQVIRLIRSKGVGIFFISQLPTDIPDVILGQLGNRVQHALRAYTPRDQKAIKAASETFRTNPAFKTEEAILSLETGEALVSFLDEKGAPSVVERAKVLFPLSQIGAITEGQRLDIMNANSDINRKYKEAQERESAFEQFAREAEEAAKAAEAEAAAKEAEKEEKSKKKEKTIWDKVWKAVVTAVTGTLATILGKTVSDTITGKKGKGTSIKDAAGRAAKNATSAAGRQILRDILGNVVKK